MQVVSAVVTREQLRGVARVPQNQVEIDHSIEFGAAQDPVVNLLTCGFPFGSIKSDCRFGERRVLKRRVRRPNDSNALLMGTRDELTIAGDNVLSAYLLAGGSERERRKKNVIDAKTHDDNPDACLGQHVTFEPRQARLAQACSKWVVRPFWAVMQQAIADDALIQDAQFRRSIGAFLQTLGEHVRPTPVGIRRGSISVGERGAKYHDGSRAWQSLDIYPG